MPEKLLKPLIASRIMLMALLHPQERLARLDGLADLDMDLTDHAVTRGEDLVFHLHGFDDKQRVTTLERLAGRSKHLEDLAGQRGLHEVRRSGRAMRWGRTRYGGWRRRGNLRTLCNGRGRCRDLTHRLHHRLCTSCLLDPYLECLPIHRDSENARLRSRRPEGSHVLANTDGTIRPHMTDVNHGRHRGQLFGTLNHRRLPGRFIPRRGVELAVSIVLSGGFISGPTAEELQPVADQHQKRQDRKHHQHVYEGQPQTRSNSIRHRHHLLITYFLLPDGKGPASLDARVNSSTMTPTTPSLL